MKITPLKRKTKQRNTVQKNTNKKKIEEGEGGAGGSGGSGSGGGGGSNSLPLWVQIGLALPLLVLLFSPNIAFRDGNQTSFQQFRIHMLEPGLVDHIEVINKQKARVVLRSDLPSGEHELHDDDRVNCVTFVCLLSVCVSHLCHL